MSNSKLKLNYLPELKSTLLGRKKPSMVSVNLTSKCNQNCIYCEVNKTPEIETKDLLNKDDLFWIIDQMQKSGISRLSLCGGEPFLFDGIFEVVAYAYKREIKCNISSNGMIISNFSADELNLLSRCETQINLSIDSFNEKVQVKTRGNKLALNNALSSITILKEYNICLTILTVISKYNYTALFQSYLRASELGIKEILYQPIIYASNYPDKIALKNKNELNVPVEGLNKLNNQLDKIYRSEKRYRLKTNVYRLKLWIFEYIKSTMQNEKQPFYFRILKKFYCREAFAVIDINYYGGIQPCGLLRAGTGIKQNKVDDLLSQWEKATQGLKQDLRNKNFPAVCDSCCHKFSRNMIASAFRYPFANRKALIVIVYLLLNRMANRFYRY